ncbi:MAG: aminotransferase class V-fold PLP-dependent enzyme [Alphaproteobacteria bacterium]|nr:aminotransferase class V-fold PLP-dependent enzyme [Alphaproteobacteria bacterium]
MSPFLRETFAIIEARSARIDADDPAPLPEPVGLSHALSLTLDGEATSEEALTELLAGISEATPATGGGRFYNQLFGSLEPAAVAAELLSVVFNSSMYTYKVAGPHVLIEAELVRRMCEAVGYAPGEGGGAMTPGGSMANLLGLRLGRNAIAPESRELGLYGRAPLLVYCSAEAHYSIAKNAGLLGMGRRYVRAIEVDGQGRMRPEALREAVRADRARGLQPAVVVATAGTTVRGAFDPIDAIADVCEAEGLWLHVDGAYGGTLLLHPEAREALQGSARADSFAWNPHKMMGVPLSCSFLLTRHPEALAEDLGTAASYLFQLHDDTLNPGTRSMQCGRRNDAFKLWALWKHLGDAGLAERVERQLALTRHAAERIRQHPGLQLVGEPSCANTCFEAPGVPSEEICRVLAERGLAMIGHGRVEGRAVLRLVTVNLDATTEHLDRLLEDILQVAEELAGAGAA